MQEGGHTQSPSNNTGIGLLAIFTGKARPEAEDPLIPSVPPARKAAGGGNGWQDLGQLCPMESLLVPLHGWFEPKTVFPGAPDRIGHGVIETPMQLIHLAPREPG